MTSTRKEHLTWCKERALEYLERGDLPNAVSSMVSDMRKHEGTKDVPNEMNMIGLQAAMSGSSSEVRKWIEGFN